MMESLCTRMSDLGTKFGKSNKKRRRKPNESIKKKRNIEHKKVEAEHN